MSPLLSLSSANPFISLRLKACVKLLQLLLFCFLDSFLSQQVHFFFCFSCCVLFLSFTAFASWGWITNIKQELTRGVLQHVASGVEEAVLEVLRQDGEAEVGELEVAVVVEDWEVLRLESRWATSLRWQKRSTETSCWKSRRARFFGSLP